jgi:muramoyltetrapeptide carboxypeptidase
VGSSRLLETINTRRIAQSGKPLLGFSDVTVLQWLLWERERLVTFTGPLAVEWDGDLSERTRRQAFRILGGTADPDLLADWPHDSVRVLRDGRKAVGRLLPGNLTMIATLLGTPYCPDLRGAILLVEDVNEPAHRVDRLLFHLRNAGVLGQIEALLVGDLSGEGNGESAVHSLLDATRGETYPMAMNLPYSHGPERMTLPVGGLVEFCSDSMSLSLLESVTRATS